LFLILNLFCIYFDLALLICIISTDFSVFSISKDVEFVPTSTPRKWLGCKSKQEVFDLLKTYCKNNDESDALALLLYTIKKKENEVQIERVY